MLKIRYVLLIILAHFPYTSSLFKLDSIKINKQFSQFVKHIVVTSCSLTLFNYPAYSRDFSTTLINEGMVAFRNYDIAKSIELFDEAIKYKPSIKPYVWQRGISLYYMKDYNQCSKQFHEDVTVNPYDTEEIIWGLVCDSKQQGNLNKNLQESMELLPEPDKRPVMKDIYNLFKGDINSIKLSTNDNLINPSRYFYSHLYTGLYQEAQGDKANSLTNINLAVNSLYCSTTMANKENDYMCAVAANHEILRSANNIIQ